MLVSLYEQDSSDKVGDSLIATLKGILVGQDTSSESQGQRVEQINKLLTELQFHNVLGWVEDRGAVLAQPIQMAEALCSHWTGVTQPKGDSLDNCRRYLQTLGLPPNFGVMARALFRPLTPELVQESLKRLSSYSSLGEDGVPASVFHKFSKFYEPLMLQVAANSFTLGSLPQEWALGLINWIPKCAGPATVTKLRPIALQTIKQQIALHRGR
uniref:Uncharacterized protein n=1 Tax=Eutreptiella gymnastica TaxID=73025 RepID=A0A7S4CZ67_9EUGL